MTGKGEASPVPNQPVVYGRMTRWDGLIGADGEGGGCDDPTLER